MNLNHINKSRMYHATDKVLEANRNLFTGLDELNAAHRQLRDFLTLIDENRQVQESNQTGITENKVVLRNVLMTSVQKCMAGLLALATATKDVPLRTKVKYSPSDLVRMPDPVLSDVAALIRNETGKRLPDLQKYFVTPELLAELDSQILQFKEAIPQKRVATNISKVSTQNIAGVFADTDKLLKNEIDMLMLPFQFTQPDFYNAYKNARIIVNYSGRGKTPEQPEAPAE